MPAWGGDTLPSQRVPQKILKLGNDPDGAPNDPYHVEHYSISSSPIIQLCCQEVHRVQEEVQLLQALHLQNFTRIEDHNFPDQNYVYCYHVRVK